MMGFGAAKHCNQVAGFLASASILIAALQIRSGRRLCSELTQFWAAPDARLELCPCGLPDTATSAGPSIWPLPVVVLLLCLSANWDQGRDSNPRFPAYEAGEMTTSLPCAHAQ